MMEPLPREELVPPAEGGGQIQGHWAVVLGQDTALVLLVLQGTSLVLRDMAPVRQGMAPVLQGMALVLQGTVPVLQDRCPVPLVSQDRSPEDRGTPGTPQEPVAGSPRRASLVVGGQRGWGCCRRAARRITGERGEKRRVRWVALILGSG